MDKVSGNERCLVFYGFRPDIHTFASQRNNFHDLKFSLQIRVLLKAPFRVKVIVGRYNFIFLEETVNFLLRLMRKEEISLNEYVREIREKNLFDLYKRLIYIINSKLALYRINMELAADFVDDLMRICLLYTSPSPRDLSTSRMPSSA